MTQDSPSPGLHRDDEGCTRRTIIRETPPRRHSGAGLWLVFALVGMAGIIALLLFARASRDVDEVSEVVPAPPHVPVEGALLAN